MVKRVDIVFVFMCIDSNEYRYLANILLQARFSQQMVCVVGLLEGVLVCMYTHIDFRDD